MHQRSSSSELNDSDDFSAINSPPQKDHPEAPPRSRFSILADISEAVQTAQPAQPSLLSIYLRDLHDQAQQDKENLHTPGNRTPSQEGPERDRKDASCRDFEDRSSDSRPRRSTYVQNRVENLSHSRSSRFSSRRDPCEREAASGIYVYRQRIDLSQPISSPEIEAIYAHRMSRATAPPGRQTPQQDMLFSRALHLRRSDPRGC